MKSNHMKFIILYILLAVIITGFIACESIDPVIIEPVRLLDKPLYKATPNAYTNHYYETEFNLILKTLINDYYSENGIWKKDTGRGDGGCSILYSALLFYKLGVDLENKRYLNIANENTAHAYELVKNSDNILSFSNNKGLRPYIPFPSLIIAVRYQYQLEYDDQIVRMFDIAHQKIISNLEKVYEEYGNYAVPLIAYAKILYSFDSIDRKYMEYGISYFKQLKTRIWDHKGIIQRKEKGRIGGNTFNLAQILLSLSMAYRVTEDATWSNYRDEIIKYLDIWFRDTRKGGYFNSPNHNVKSLSANNSMMGALLDWYEVTGDKSYLNRTKKLIKSLYKEFFDEELNMLILDTSKKTIKNKTVCSGCNLAFLYYLYRINNGVLNIQAY